MNLLFDRRAWAIPLALIFLVGGYTLAAFAGGATMSSGQTVDEESPAPAEETPDLDLTPPPEDVDTGESLYETDAGETDVQVEQMNASEIAQFEEELNGLRERIMKTQARLMQLREQLLLGSVSIISLSILHSHEVGGAFKLESLSYTLDGFEIYTGVNTPESNLEELENFPIYEGSLLPGEHLLVVDMIFRGRGYGIFSYLNQYLFKVKARYLFTVEEGQAVTLRVISYDEGSFLTSLRNRLKVKFVQE